MDHPHPFDQPESRCSVLKNSREQYSLWPELTAIPAGWQPVFGPESQALCLAWLDTHWTDIRPARHSVTGKYYV